MSCNRFSKRYHWFKLEFKGLPHRSCVFGTWHETSLRFSNIDSSKAYTYEGVFLDRGVLIVEIPSEYKIPW